uniref:Uncharacterized protein n=1 Tax=Megaviridae environmental sample TaxID=1737588 RepID=A0A5J6VKE0_9VIRU|nr:MAG: hypothetical protein [Megaviridae environmental sample]
MEEVNTTLVLAALIVASVLQIASSSIGIINIDKVGELSNKQKNDKTFLIVMLVVSSLIIVGSIYLLYQEHKHNFEKMI